MPVIAVAHPLVRHKVGLLREAGISTKKFRELTGELARLLAYEATADFPLAPVTSFFVSWAAIPFWLMAGWALALIEEQKHIKP